MRPGALVMGITAVVILGVSPAMGSSVVCNGVFEYEGGELKAHFRCHYRGDSVRKAFATCRDGEAGCDADGTCDDVCRFALCSDASCASMFTVSVPLHRGGKASGRRVLRFGGKKVVLRCRPSRGMCGPSGTTLPVTTTTTTTLPGPSCTVTLSGAVDATTSCRASLSTSGLGLPVLRLVVDGDETDGEVAALLVGRSTGTLLLGERMILIVARMDRPDLGYFQAVPRASGASAELRIDAIDGTAVHGALDAVLPSTLAGNRSLQVHAEF